VSNVLGSGFLEKVYEFRRVGSAHLTLIEKVQDVGKPKVEVKRVVL
jgi:hypothetical protein